MTLSHTEFQSDHQIEKPILTVVRATVKNILKRDNKTLQAFDADKIKRAISKAWNDTKGNIDERAIAKIAATAVDILDGDTIQVETIQDVVETSLMRHGQFAVAKAYILYRHQRSEARQIRTQKEPDQKAISDYIHVSKYARYLPKKKRREIYEETVSRVENMHIQKYPKMEEDIRWAFDRVREKRVLPSMRSMQFGGAAITTNNNRIYNCSFSLVDRPEAFSEALYLLLCGCGVGYSVQIDHVEKLPVISYINEKNVQHHIVQDTVEGWADGLKALIQSYIDGTNLEISYHLVRPAGTPLKTSGGKAPGHIKLKVALEAIRTILNAAQGRKLRPVECHRIMCRAADAVLSGGVRRSAMICLFSLDDSEMMHIKTGNWFASEPYLANANNSVVLKRDEIKKKQFKRIFGMTRQWGEPGFYFTNDYDYGTNPCFHPDTRVTTTNGLIRIEDLCEEYKDTNNLNIIVQTPDGPQIKAATVFETGVKNVLEVHTRRGRILKVTPDHQLMTTDGWVEAQELNENSVLCLQAGVGSNLVKKSTIDLMWYKIAGWLVGDGYVASHKPNKNNYSIGLCFGKYDKSALKKVEKFLSENDEYFNTSRFPGSIGESPDTITISRKSVWDIMTNLASDPGSRASNKYVKESIFQACSEEQLAYISGLFSADGTLNLHPKKSFDARFSSTSIALLRGIQDILLNHGVNSTIYKDRQSGQQPKSFTYTTSSGEDRTYFSKEKLNELVITGQSLRAFKKLMLSVGLLHDEKQSKFDEIPDTINNYGRDRWIDEVVKIIDNGETVTVYDITEPDTNSLIANGIVAHNCCEIGLNPKLVVSTELCEKLASRGIFSTVGAIHTGWAFCNLCEINAAKLKSFQDFSDAARAATIIGTLQAGYTEMPYLGWISEEIAKKEALLGIGMTGMLDSPQIACNPMFQREIAGKIKKWNAEYSAMIGINAAARTTCVKPSGTTSLELGCVGSGHHPHHARRYIRRVTADELESVFQTFKAVNPHMCVRKPDGKWVIEFPVVAPIDATVKDDITAIPFLDMVKSTQQNWVLEGTADDSISPGLSHNVSNTVTVRADEWDKVSDYLWENREFFTGVSLLSSNGDKDFAFSPFESVITQTDEVRWNAILDEYKPVDYTLMVEQNDDTNLNGEVACAGGVCSII